MVELWDNSSPLHASCEYFAPITYVCLKYKIPTYIVYTSGIYQYQYILYNNIYNIPIIYISNNSIHQLILSIISMLLNFDFNILENCINIMLYNII